jgi:Ca-activated chloride channel homolog
MATRDGDRGGALLDRSRLDEARRRVAAVLDDALPEEYFLLVSAASAPRTQGPWTQERAMLDAVLLDLDVTDAGLDADRALRAAGDALRGRGNGRVVLVTDGGPPTANMRALSGDGAARPGIAPLPDGVELSHVLVGPARVLVAARPSGPAALANPIDNLAVERVGLRERAEDPGRGVVYVRVRNDRDSNTRARVLLCARSEGQSLEDFAMPEAVIAEQVVTVDARSVLAVQFADVSLTGGRFAVRVQPAAGANWQDRAAWDDWGFAVAARRRRVGVLLVTRGNLFIEAALLANDRVDVRKIGPDNYKAGTFTRDRRLEHGVDVVVLDQIAAAAPTSTPVLRFDLRGHDAAAAGPLEPRSATDLKVIADRHPVTRSLSMHDSHIDGLRPLTATPGATVLIAEADGSAAAIARDDGVRRIDVGLDLLETDLGGRFFLPLLLGNAVDWLAGEEEPVVSPLEVGRPWAIGMPVAADDWRWTEPGRPEISARTSDDALLAVSERQGIHVWRSGTGFEIARPTALPPNERPDLVAISGAAWQTRSADDHRQAPGAPLPAWALLAAAVMAVLVLEWWLYQRRRTV